ncbi:hypothetical protein PLICRDRAFT_67453, partial [Plicaturopsis crispa FD-325 SS-3]
IRQHLKPLAIASNATQSDHARLNVVLAAIVNLYWVFSRPAMDPRVSTSILRSVEKRWANTDRELFLLAILLNPYLRRTPFKNGSPFCGFVAPWEIFRRAYLQFFQVEPDVKCRTAFSDYLNNVGRWSAKSMQLDVIRESYKKQPVNLLCVWWEHDTNTVNGANGVARLALVILSIVPNSAATERLVSKFGSVHSKSRNCTNAERVRKTTLLKTDIEEK